MLFRDHAVRLLLLRPPLLVGLALVRERLAQRGIIVAEQARERAVLRHVDAHFLSVPQALAHMNMHDLYDRDTALGSGLERGVVAALERSRCVDDARRLHLHARYQIGFGDLDFADLGWEIDRA